MQEVGGLIRAYIGFAARHWRPLLFGASLMALSGFGQTFFLSAFGGEFRQAFRLSDGELGAFYAAATFLGAMALPLLGPRIDRVGVRRFAWAVAVALAGAGLVVALSPGPVVFAAGLCLVRAVGQGLMHHAAQTATAWALPSDVGKALALARLGSSAGQAVFPVAAVWLTAQVGWRWTWALVAGVVLVGAHLALACLPRDDGEAEGAGERVRAAAAPTGGGGASSWRDPRVLLALPALLAVSFILTGLVFHQARLAAEKGWTLEWLAGWLAAFAAAQAATSLAAGPVFDRVGAVRLLPLFLVPQGVGLVLLALSPSPWAAPAYLVLTAVSAALDLGMATKLWTELWGAAHLARAQSAFEAARLVVTGGAPVAMGVLVDQGVPLSTQALGYAAFIAGASALAAMLPAVGGGGPAAR